MSLRVDRLEVENIRGIENGILEPKTITVLRGDNGTGKSSWLDAMRVIFDGGYDPLMVRRGEKKARVEMTLSDGTTCTRIINAEKKTATLTVKSADGEVIKSPQAYIEGLADSFAYDPLDFMFANKKKRQELIQAFLNVAVTSEELHAAVGDDWYTEHYDRRKNAFENIEAIYKAAYERRRKVNVQFEEASKTIQTLRREIPTVAEDGSEFEKAATTARNALESARSAKRVAEAELREQYEAEKERIASWEREEIAKIKASAQEQLAQAGKLKYTVQEEIASHHNPLIEAAALESQRADESLSAYHKAEGIRDHLKQMDARAKELAGQSAQYDRALERLDTLRKKKMEDLPIEGAEMRDGDLYIDGIAFDGLNTQRQMEVCVQIAASRAGELAFMVIDGIERLSKDNQALLYEAAAKNGFQILAAEVVDGMPLQPWDETPVEA